jgi:origin recognition complex subunit 4
VKLNGFIHTDDKLALKEIWRQLGREMEVEDDNKVSFSFQPYHLSIDVL